MCEMNYNSIKDLLNALVANTTTENPLDYHKHMYDSINPIMIEAALINAQSIIENENAKTSKSKKNKEDAEVYITLGGESMTQSMYTGIIATLLWIPQYLKDNAKTFGVSQHDLDIALSVFDKYAFPKAHDTKEETINGEKVLIKPSNVRHYTAFLSAIVSWLNSGVSSFTVEGIMKTNLEIARYLSAIALNSFPSVPFGCYHVGKCKTTDIMQLTETLGKSFNWLDYMTDESYAINEPKFVVTTSNAPIVSIVGHPLTETFAVKTENGISKWLGVFVETEEFSKICIQHGLTVDQLKKYIISTSESQHAENIAKNDPIALFIEKQKMTSEIFKLRHKFSSVKDENEIEKYDI